MTRTVTCERCGSDIKGIGWKLMPARVENGELVGTVPVDIDAGRNTVIGDPLDFCADCLYGARHPLAPEPETADPGDGGETVVENDGGALDG